MKIINSDKPEEVEEYTSPMRDLELKGCNKIQALGGVETYSRRYLYMSAFDIIENDMFDVTSGKENEKKELKATPEQVKFLANVYKGDLLTKLLESNKITKLEDLPIQKASALITAIKKKGEKTNE